MRKRTRLLLDQVDVLRISVRQLLEEHKVILDHLGLQESYTCDKRSLIASGHYHGINKSLQGRVSTLESWIETEVVPFTEIEYRYGVGTNDEGTALDWAVSTDGPGSWELTIMDGTAETHAEAWEAIKQAIQEHRLQRIEDRAFSNMSESGTVKW